MKDEDLLSILKEDINEEVLSRLPEWFKVLRSSVEEREKKIKFV